jgi:hypothetical protein
MHSHIYNVHVPTDSDEVITVRCSCGDETSFPMYSKDRIQCDRVYRWGEKDRYVRVTSIDHDEHPTVRYVVLGGEGAHPQSRARPIQGDGGV